MFRIDKFTETVFFHDGEDGQRLMQKPDGSEEVVPDPRDWVVGAAYLARCFGLTVQRIYQLRDLGVFNTEEEKDKGEEVYNLFLAIKDMIEFKSFGRNGVFSGGPLRCARKKDCDPFDYSDFGIQFENI